LLTIGEIIVPSPAYLIILSPVIRAVFADVPCSTLLKVIWPSATKFFPRVASWYVAVTMYVNWEYDPLNWFWLTVKAPVVELTVSPFVELTSARVPFPYCLSQSQVILAETGDPA